MIKLCYVFLLLAGLVMLTTAPIIGSTTVAILAGCVSLFSLAGILTND